MPNLPNESHSDDAYYSSVGIHQPMWSYIVDRFRSEATTRIVGLFTRVVSPLIELSRWGYVIDLVVPTLKEAEQVQAESKQQAGNFRRIIVDDPLWSHPPAEIYLFINVLSKYNDSDCKRYVKELFEKCKIIVCAEKGNRDWRQLLSSDYDTVVKKYPYADYYLLVIEKK